MSPTVLERSAYSSIRNVRYILVVVACLLGGVLLAHEVTGSDARFLTSLTGPAPLPYLYLGAKHMVTGYDHLMYLAGVIFFLVRLRDILLYVSLFTLGHSLTLVFGVLTETNVNAFLIDAIIGLSVVYKAFENMGGFERLNLQLNTKVAVSIFGLFHGLGLATKLHELISGSEGLVTNLISFNIGVELGQIYALALLFLVFTTFRQILQREHVSHAINSVLMTGGFLLVIYQLTGFFIGGDG